MKFRVTIPYVEPTFALRLGRCLSYTCDLLVFAQDEAGARATALRRFELEARESGVAWIREPLLDQVVVRAA